MAKPANVIVLPELTASAGLITWWRLSGDVDIEALTQAWEVAGFDREDLPSTPSDTVALRRALKGLYEKPGVQITSVPRGYAIVDMDCKEVEGDVPPDPVYSVRFKVHLDMGVVQVSKTGEPYRKDIWQAFQEAQQRVDAHDLSSWLVCRADEMNALRLRDNGGIYFVPETRTAVWMAQARALESVSKCIIYEIPAQRSERALTALMDAMQAEAQEAAAKINAQVETGELGKRALQSRKNDCKAMLHKVEEYEKLLGTRMDALHSLINNVEARLVEAVLAAD